VYGYSSELQVQLDALLGLSCLLSSGSTHSKLQLCFWALDRCAAAAAAAAAHGSCDWGLVCVGGSSRQHVTWCSDSVAVEVHDAISSSQKQAAAYFCAQQL
jgi:hypothetical protein